MECGSKRVYIPPMIDKSLIIHLRQDKEQGDIRIKSKNQTHSGRNDRDQNSSESCKKKYTRTAGELQKEVQQQLHAQLELQIEAQAKNMFEFQQKIEVNQQCKEEPCSRQ
ncbi:hypothetical protein SELMODRAFT_425039 [Selaginella moellendorffii]|uniref:Uncharacterized protein n=1 Tax=Selaginella moellendorffii TaxID=88036 RepID=D8SRU4_SELML|nr:hypothetical protein SELMODRAFT_425039 [Selaginella moellendorffii]